MLSKKQKGAYLAVGGSASALIFWLCYAESAEKARGFLGESTERVTRILGEIEAVLATVRVRTEQIDRFLEEVIRVAQEQTHKVDTVLNNAVRRFEQTGDVIQKNVADSSIEIGVLLKEFKDELDQLISAKASRAA